MLNFQLQVPVLGGALVRLEPLSINHAADLAVAAEEDRTAYAFTEVPHECQVVDYINTQLRRATEGKLVPFAQVRPSDGRAVGCTAFWDPRSWPDRPELCAIEIGWTWLAASAQRTGINVEAKLLLLEYAFDTWNVARVDLKTDARNTQCCRALEQLGAKFEGVLRCWSPSRAPGESGRMRDSAMFSVVATEWPATKEMLRRRIDHGR